MKQIIVIIVSLFIDSDSHSKEQAVKLFTISVILTCLCLAVFLIASLAFYVFFPPLSVDDFPGLENAYSDLINKGYFKDVKLFQDGSTWIDVYGYTPPGTKDKDFENHCKVLLEATNQYIPAEKYCVRAVLSSMGEHPSFYCNQRE